MPWGRGPGFDGDLSIHVSNGHNVQGKEIGQLTPIFSRSSSNSDGRAPNNVGAAGNPTYFATPAMTETS